MMGGPPPPPPPFGGPMPFAPVMNQLPFGMKEKRKYKVDAPLKRINWDKIAVKDLKQNAFWVNADEQKYASEDFVEFLVDNFSTKKAKFNVDNSSSSINDQDKKKQKTLKFIDEKQAQNLSILLKSLKVEATEISNWLLHCNMEKLTESCLEQLDKSLPEDKVIQEYGSLTNCLSELEACEQFLVELSKIKGLRKRIQSLIFRHKFSDQLESAKAV